MGLAAYGTPRYRDAMQKMLVMGEHGQFLSQPRNTSLAFSRVAMRTF